MHAHTGRQTIPKHTLPPALSTGWAEGITMRPQLAAAVASTTDHECNSLQVMNKHQR